MKTSYEMMYLIGMIIFIAIIITYFIYRSTKKAVSNNDNEITKAAKNVEKSLSAFYKKESNVVRRPDNEALTIAQRLFGREFHDIPIITKRPIGMDYFRYRDELKSNQKLIREALK